MRTDDVEPIGDETVIYATVDDTATTVSASGDRIVGVGDAIHFLFPKARLHIFDRITGVAAKNREWTVAEDDTTIHI